MYHNSSYFSVIGYSAASNYSSLEERLQQYSISQYSAGSNIPQTIHPFYVKQETYGGYNAPARHTMEYSASAQVFLNADRPFSHFVDSAELICDFVIAAFKATACRDLPDDVVVSVCSPIEMLAINPKWHPGILGFSINRLGFGVSEIFLLENELDILLVTAGHELGHVISFPAGSRLDEEAKAFAFEAAWVQAIFRDDIAGLRYSINLDVLSPANNGLHDAAFNFVRRQMFFGRNALEIHRELSNGKMVVGI